MTAFDKSSLLSLLHCDEIQFMLYMERREYTIYCIQPVINTRGGERMREAETRNNDEKMLRWKLENSYSQGKIEEAVRLGRRLDDMQCQLFMEASELKKAAG